MQELLPEEEKNKSVNFPMMSHKICFKGVLARADTHFSKIYGLPKNADFFFKFSKFI